MNISKNQYKHLVNVDLINSYLLLNNLTKNDFCKKLKIDKKLLNKILKRKLDYVPFCLWDIAENIGVDIKNLINGKLILKYNLKVFEKDSFLIH